MSCSRQEAGKVRGRMLPLSENHMFRSSLPRLRALVMLFGLQLLLVRSYAIRSCYVTRERPQAGYPNVVMISGDCLLSIHFLKDDVAVGFMAIGFGVKPSLSVDNYDTGVDKVSQGRIMLVNLTVSGFTQGWLRPGGSVTFTIVNVTASENCQAVARGYETCRGQGVDSGLGFVYARQCVDASGRHTFQNLNITCSTPSIGPPPWDLSGDEGFLVTSGQEFQNALFSLCDIQGPFLEVSKAVTLRSNLSKVYLVNNVSLTANIWPSQMNMSHNISVIGSPWMRTVLNWDLMTYKIMLLNKSVSMTFVNVYSMNLSPLRGKTVSRGWQLPLYSYPYWPVVVDGDLMERSLTFINCTWLLPASELEVFNLATTFMNSDLHLNRTISAVLLNQTFYELKVDVNAMPEDPSNLAASTTWSVVRGDMLSATNLTITSAEAGVYRWLMKETFVPSLNYEIEDGSTTFPVYTASDLFGLLTDYEAEPNEEDVWVVLTQDISLQNLTWQQLWPEKGFAIKGKLLLKGFSPNAFPVLDLGSVPTFLHVEEGSRLRIENIHLVNLAPSPQASWAGGTTLPTVCPSYITVESPLSRLTSKTLSKPVVDISNCTLTVPREEVQTLWQYFGLRQVPQLDPSGAIAGSKLLDASSGSGASLPVVSNRHLQFESINFSNPSYRMQFVNITDQPPPNVVMNYVDLPTTDQPPLPVWAESPDRNSDELSAGAIAGIVGGSVVGVALLVGLAWLLLLRRRRANEEQAKKVEMLGGSGASNTESLHAGSDSEHFAPPTRDLEETDSEKEEAAQSRESYTGAGDISQLPRDELNNLIKSLEAEFDDVQLVLDDVLGKGGFGVVYKGVWKGLQVAVKTLIFQDKMFGGGKAQTTAIHEAAISTSLSHPNVVSTYSHVIRPLHVRVRDQKTDKTERTEDSAVTSDSEQAFGFTLAPVVTDWKLYIIQEYCDGGTLRQTTLKRKFWNEEKLQPRVDLVLLCALEIAKGLSHLHGKNIIHGDLNLNNVLLKSNKDSAFSFTCKLADFGLSLKMQAGQSHISNMRRGTPFYTAPEVLKWGNMTKAADVFSFGVIMWEMFHSMMCYKTMPDKQFVQRTIFPRFPRKAPQQFTTLVHACLSSNNKSRPSVQDIIEKLTDMLVLHQAGNLPYGAAEEKGEANPKAVIPLMKV